MHALSELSLLLRHLLQAPTPFLGRLGLGWPSRCFLLTTGTSPCLGVCMALNKASQGPLYLFSCLSLSKTGRENCVCHVASGTPSPPSGRLTSHRHSNDRLICFTKVHTPTEGDTHTHLHLSFKNSKSRGRKEEGFLPGRQHEARPATPWIPQASLFHASFLPQCFGMAWPLPGKRHGAAKSGTPFFLHFSLQFLMGMGT